MNDTNKWIKLHSKMLNWEWYKNANTMRVFIHCLLKANWKDGKFQGKDISRGSFVTSLETLSKELGLSVQQIRTSLNHLISTNEITNESFSQYRIITVVNYELYQQVNKENNNQITNNQQTTNNQLTTIEEYKNARILDDIDNNKTTTTTKGKVSARENLLELMEQAFGRPLSDTEFEIINTWEDNDLTRYAIKQMELARAFNVRYVQSILRSYKRDNIKNVAEAEERERKFQESKTTKKQITNNSESYTQRRLREERERDKTRTS